jgi:hypothetical protein
MTQNPRHIVISDEEHALPYSKGLMASSIMATGLPPARAFNVAERIEERLRARGMASITRAELSDLASQVLVEQVGQRYADSPDHPDRRGDGRGEVDGRHPAGRPARHHPDHPH